MEVVRSNYFSQEAVLQKKEQSIPSRREVPACVFSKETEIKESADSHLPVDSCAATSNSYKKSLHDRLPPKANNETLQQLKLITNELQEETICHKTALFIQKHFTKDKLSDASIFLSGDKDKYKKYINADENYDYIFLHKLNVSAYGDEGNKHDFVIVRINKEFYLLQSMVEMFTLKQWISGECKGIDEAEKKLKVAKDLYSLYQGNKHPRPLSEKQVDSLKKAPGYYKEFKKAKPAFNRVVNTKRNKPVSKAIFNQKLLPTLFAALTNSSDLPYFRIFSTSRTFLTIKPEYEVFFEVYKTKILTKV